MGILASCQAPRGSPELGQFLLCQAQPVLESLNRLLEDVCSRDDLLQAAVPVEEDREMGSRGPHQEPTKEGLPPALQDAPSHREGHSSKKGRKAGHIKARWGTSPRRTPSPFSSFAFPHQEEPDGARRNCSSSARLGEEQGIGFLGRRSCHMGAKEEKGPAGLARLSLFGWETHVLGSVRLPSTPLPTKAWYKATIAETTTNLGLPRNVLGFCSDGAKHARLLFGREIIRTLDSDALQNGTIGTKGGLKSPLPGLACAQASLGERPKVVFAGHAMSG